MRKYIKFPIILLKNFKNKRLFIIYSYKYYIFAINKKLGYGVIGEHTTL